ncbi:VanZ family protein [Bacillus massilinigeriensis]|uniref:VanZ family protein n=1 Tax=Bacillus massilionigeriensis TaxID=1805475 RepID=UPI00096B616C|nr:VanZ family protein [Bacillus massilionigeriensis]
MKNIIRHIIIGILPILYLGLIWVQSSHFDPSSIEHFSNTIDEKILFVIGAFFELAHLVEFGLLYLFILIAFRTLRILNQKSDNLAVIFALIYGILDEVHQIFVPFRSFSVTDLLKDFIGIFIVWLFVHKTRYGLQLKGRPVSK